MEIIQIIPAGDCSCSFTENGAKEAFHTEKLKCWALCRSDDGDSFVTGMVQAPNGQLKSVAALAQESGVLIRYLFPEEKK